MSKKGKIPASDDAWESGKLGDDPEFARVSSDSDAAIDGAAGLLQISIRLQRSLVEDFKRLAESQGIGYQPLMRQALTLYVQAMKDMAQERPKPSPVGVFKRRANG